MRAPVIAKSHGTQRNSASCCAWVRALLANAASAKRMLHKQLIWMRRYRQWYVGAGSGRFAVDMPSNSSNWLSASV